MTDTTAPPAYRQAIDDMHAGLDALAAWIDAHPDLPLYHSSGLMSGVWSIHHPEDVPGTVRAITDGALIGSVSKHEQGDNGETLRVERRFGGGIYLALYAARDEVCTAKVTGTETVMVPDPAAPMVEVERDIIEWECAPILASVQP